MRFRNVLVLAAHPDDEMGCAGTIARLTDEGAYVGLLTFSQCSDLNGDELLEEWHAATALLGIRDPQMFDLPNRQFPAHRQRILNILDQRRSGFDLILAPATTDAHQDHATVAAEVARAYKHSTILGYELPLNQLGSTELQAFVSLQPEHVDRKATHAYTYRSQAGKPYMAESFIRGLAAVRGVQAGVPAAEAFEVIRWVL